MEFSLHLSMSMDPHPHHSVPLEILSSPAVSCRWSSAALRECNPRCRRRGQPPPLAVREERTRDNGCHADEVPKRSGRLPGETSWSQKAVYGEVDCPYIISITLPYKVNEHSITLPYKVNEHSDKEGGQTSQQRTI